MNSPSKIPKRMPRHRQIHLVGILVLVIGLLSAFVIYLMALAETGAHNVPDFSGDRRFNLELERIGGKSAIYLAALDHWLSGLWQGTALAFTVGTLSVFIALACFWLANLMSYPLIEATQPSSPESSDRQAN